jgi:hypothetical protein
VDATALSSLFGNPIAVEDSLRSADGHILPGSAVNRFADLAGVKALFVPQPAGLGSFRMRGTLSNSAAVSRALEFLTLPTAIGQILLDHTPQPWSRWADVLVIVKPETVVGLHRAGFRLY